MADKAITELIEASQVTGTDSFVLEQNGTAKRLTGQTLINYLLKMIDGHGGISGISKVSTSGLVDTYRINLADLTVFDFYVTNGRAISSITQTAASGLTRTYTIVFNDGSSETFKVTDGRSIISVEQTGINGLTRTYTISFNDGTSQTFPVTDGRSITKIEKTSTSGLVDSYTITFNDGSSGSFTVTNGEKGDKGDNTYLWIKYSSQEPTESSHSIGNLPDDWIGIYFGPLSAAPNDWKAYSWFKIKGEKGDTGSPATLVSSAVTYQVGDSGTIIPSGTWGTSIPVVAQGKYLWTRIVQTFNTGSPVTAYTVSRMGLDGMGSVVSVCNISPDDNGNVSLTAEDVGALSSTGGDLTGELRMNGQPIKGLNDPTANDQAANMGYVNNQVKKAAPRNLLDNSDFRNPVNQRGQTSYAAKGYTIDRWDAYNTGLTVNVGDGYIELVNTTNATVNYVQKLEKKVSVGKSITIAFKLQDGSIRTNKGVVAASGSTAPIYDNDYSIYYNGASGWLTLGIYAGKSIKLEWIAIYEGEYTAETLPEYQPKGYGAELAECQRYYVRYVADHGTNMQFAVGGSNGTSVYAPLLLPVPMRISPSIAWSNVNLYEYVSGSKIEISDLTIEGRASSNNCVVLQANQKTAGTIADKSVANIRILADGYIALSADL